MKCLRAAAVLSAVAIVAACGGRHDSWPRCLHANRPLLVEIASPSGLRQVDPRFEAVRAAAVTYRGRVDATVVRSRTGQGAGRVQLALRIMSFGVAPPLLPRGSRPSAVVRRGAVVLQWFGTRDHEREQALLDCAAS